MSSRLTYTVILLAACGGSSDPSDGDVDGTICPSTMTEGDVCVDPNRGVDTSPGTSDAPVKTITRALELVGKHGAGRSVVLLDGMYDAPGGESFPLTVPTTITLTGISTVNAETIEVSGAASSQTARILGEGALVNMAPGSTLSHVIVISQGTSNAALDIDGATYGVHLTDVFAYGTKTSPIVAHGGEIIVDRAHLGPQLELKADGWITGTKLALGVAESTMTTLRGRIDVDEATLRYRNGGGIDLYATLDATNLDIESDGHPMRTVTTGDHADPYMLYVHDTAASVQVAGGTWNNVVLYERSQNSLGGPVYTLAGVTLAGATINCPMRACDLRDLSLTARSVIWANSKVTISASSFVDSALTVATGSTVTVRDSTFGDGATIVATSASAPAAKLDLGTLDAPGNNTFKDTPGSTPESGPTPAFLNMYYWDGAAVSAVGNQWVPNESGADAQGHFASGTYTDWMMGKNVLKRGTATVLF